MRRCFGEVINGAMQLNDYGVIADTLWLWLAEQHPYVILHAHIVMHSMPGPTICMGYWRSILGGWDLREGYGRLASRPYRTSHPPRK
jgi:hypothetical protein